ncbi:hypothetical protein Mal35_42770 [Gimesia maris]|uniref:hypothetical protein n=1 Tax=Gimesia maris TaxID=122 RepID=UPI00118C1266|nr:hypothetical protein [Gimesia maris]QDT80802.1 hypothetical protein Mal35_42770 [Gimesia maris]
MNELNDRNLEIYHSLNPKQFSYLKSLHFYNQKWLGESEQCLSLVMSQSSYLKGKELYLEFHGVKNLVFSQPSLSLVSIQFLEIRKHSDESVFSEQYLVLDPEQEQVILFECRDFIAAVNQERG